MFETVQPMEIERRSFEIITHLLGERAIWVSVTMSQPFRRASMPRLTACSVNTRLSA